MIFKLIVFIWKLFSLPYRITRMLITRDRQEREDAETLLDVLKNHKED